MTPREKRDKIKSFLFDHLLNALDPEKMADKSIPKPSASMLNVALSTLKATDDTLGQPTAEEIKQRAEEEAKAREEMGMMVNGRPFVYRIDLDEDSNQTPSTTNEESSTVTTNDPIEEIAQDLVAQEKVEPPRTETTSFSEWLRQRR